LVWSQLAEIKTPPIVTTDFLYIRLIGDRTIQEADFGKIQKDGVIEMKWLRNIKRVEKSEKKTRISKDVVLAIVSANNHYASFGPGTANTFRKTIVLEEAKWEDIGYEHQATNDDNEKMVSKQTTLSDFAS
jgi:hypothetical protein